MVKQVISALVTSPYCYALAAYARTHPIQLISALAFVVKFPALPTGNILSSNIQLCNPLGAVRANVPFPHAIPSLGGCGANRPRNTVDSHRVAVGVPEGIQRTAFGVGIKLCTRFGVRQPATHVRKKWQSYAG